MQPNPGSQFPPPGYSYGPPPMRVRIEAITDACRLVFSDLTPWVVGMLLMCLPVVLIYFGIFATMLGLIVSGSGSKAPSMAWIGGIIGLTVLLLLSMFPLMLIQVSLQRIGLLKLRGRAVEVKDLFRLDGAGWTVMGWFVLMCGAGLAFFGLIVGLMAAFGMLASHATGATLLPFIGVFGMFGFEFLLVIASLVIQAIVAFVPLIIVDQRLGVIDAFRLSLRTFKRHLLMVVVVLLVTGIIAQLGFYACGIGFFFTGGISIAAVPVMYNDFFRPAFSAAGPIETARAPGTFDV